jgi:DNA-binding beta-propeller fold protein YncE
MVRFALVCFLLAAFVFFCPPAGVADGPISGDCVDVDLYGNIYVLDREKNTLCQYDRNLNLLREIGGQGWEGERFDRPAGLWARNGIDVYVADYGNHRIVRFDRSLNFISSFSTRESDNPDERFGYPGDVALSRLGELYICDTENSRILKVDRQNTVAGSFGGFGAGKGRLLTPAQIEVSPQDAVYVVDGKRIVVFDVFGNFTGVLADGVIHDPRALWTDQRGVLVVDGDMLYCFDDHQRPICSLALATLLGNEHVRVRSVAVSGDLMYVLTESGLTTAPDPRASLRSPGLDKE